jgi:hypothetical protein
VPLGLLYLAVFSAIVRATRFFSSEDLAWFEEILPGPLGRAVKSPLAHRLAGA